MKCWIGRHDPEVAVQHQERLVQSRHDLFGIAAGILCRLLGCILGRESGFEGCYPLSKSGNFGCPWLWCGAYRVCHRTLYLFARLALGFRELLSTSTRHGIVGLLVSIHGGPAAFQHNLTLAV